MSEEWIECEDRLPERGDYLVVTRGFVQEGKLGNGGHWFSSELSGVCEITVTHWQPLPEPPKVEQE